MDVGQLVLVSAYWPGKPKELGIITKITGDKARILFENLEYKDEFIPSYKIRTLNDLEVYTGNAPESLKKLYDSEHARQKAGYRRSRRSKTRSKSRRSKSRR
jgi:hypothetical protein